MGILCTCFLMRGNFLPGFNDEPPGKTKLDQRFIFLSKIPKGGSRMSTFAHLRIGTKLLGGFLLLAIISTTVNILNVVHLAKIKDMQQKMHTLNIKPMKEVMELIEAFQKTRVNLRDVILASTPEALDKAMEQLKENNKVIDESVDVIDASSKSAKKAVQETREALAAYKAFQEKLVGMVRAGKKGEADAYGKTPEIAQIIKSCTDKVKGLSAAKIQNANKRVQGTIELTVSSLEISVASSVVMLLVAVGLGFFVTRVITRPIHDLARKAEQIAGGDLTIQVAQNSHDEIGELAGSFARMAGSLHDTLCRVSDTSSQVAAASEHLQTTSGRISDGTEEVARQAITVATASEELSATSGDIAQNCHAAAQSSRQANNAAETGAAVVAQTVDVMSRIADRVNSTARTVEALGTRSDQIGDIIGTIEDIADQTNLLALNAAIEAARAGEQGRGFAVVADEVRALAERTTKATKEIGEMIKSIQLETRGAVTEMEQGVIEVRQGTDEASKSGAALQEIIDQINAVTMQVSQIATAAEEQSATTGDITQNIQMISEVVQETAQRSQESANDAGRLANLSEELRSLVKRFRLA